MKKSKPRKIRSKPCCICRKRFIPNPRLADRHKTCGHQACKTQRKREVQGKWARKNPDYWTERRLREQAARLKAGDGMPATKPPPSGLEQLPLSYIQSTMGSDAVVILAFLVRLQHRIAQVSIRRQALELERKRLEDVSRTPQVPMRAEARDKDGKLNGHEAGAAQVPIGDPEGRT